MRSATRSTWASPSPVAVFVAALALLVAGIVAVDRSAAAAATKTVAISNMAFNPDNVSIAVGDTVNWVNKETDGTQHHVQFDDGPQSPDLNPGQSWSRTFRTKAKYHYICSIHTYMEGTVTVGGGTAPPPKPAPAPPPSPTPSPTPTGPLSNVHVPALPDLPPVPTIGEDGKPHDLGDGTQLAPYTVVNGVKVFSLRMFPRKWEVTKGHFRTAWTFNGTVPGPVIKVHEGDKVKIVVRNDLPEMTGVHWHGMELPNDQDGVPGLTQKPIAPKHTFTYQWTALVPGTHWYHSHMGGGQIGRGLFGALEVVPRVGDIVSDRDYRLMIGDGALGLTLNGRSYPYTRPLVAKVGERVRIRLIGTGPELIHPIHIHGQPFEEVAQDGMTLPAPVKMDTLLVGVGQTYDIIVVPRRPGKWLVHCHIFSHSESASGMMGLVTVLDVQPSTVGYVPVPG
jgi:plastocyanin